MPAIAPFGTWESSLDATLVAASSLRIDTPVIVEQGDVYWVESRPAEAGRGVLVRWSAGQGAQDVTPPGVSVRSRVHEYGGGAFAPCAEDVAYSNDADGRLYRVRPGGGPEILTGEPGFRYADLAFDARRSRLLAVREDHRDPSREPVAAIVELPLASRGAGRVLVGGSDFYARPRVGPDGRRLAWLTWSHPDMPWDGSEVWITEVDSAGEPAGPRRVAGGPGESIGHPEWSPDGILHFVSDRSGWWNLYRWAGGAVEPVCPDTAEYGLPHWVFGQTTYAFAPDGAIIASRIDQGVARLVRIDPTRRLASPLPCDLEPAGAVQVSGEHVVVLGGSATRPRGIYRVHMATGAVDALRVESTLDVASGDVARPEAFVFDSEGGRRAHAWYYAPTHAGCRAPAGERPPLIVTGHGGPTTCADRHLNLRLQFWTTRGFAVLDVNYGGSTGHGRVYRDRLDGAWGIVDVEDCVHAARAAASRGLADARRIVMRGGSAAGFTTLCALAFHEGFAAGAVYYGVADAESLARDTHKFEARYLDGLIGPWHERADLYRARSPVHAAHRISCPVIFFQGLDDRVVPPSQSEAMVGSLRARGIEAEYHAFRGEGHGFRRADTLTACLEAELAFYRRILGLA